MELASRADWGDREDEWVRDVFIAHMHNDKITEELLSETRMNTPADEKKVLKIAELCNLHHSDHHHQLLQNKTKWLYSTSRPGGQPQNTPPNKHFDENLETSVVFDASTSGLGVAVEQNTSQT